MTPRSPSPAISSTPVSHRSWLLVGVLLSCAHIYTPTNSLGSSLEWDGSRGRVDILQGPRAHRESSQCIPDQDTTPNGVLLKLYGNPLAHVLLHHPVSIPDRLLADEGRCDVGWGRLTRKAIIFESVSTMTLWIEREKTDYQLRGWMKRGERFVGEMWEAGTERHHVSSHLSTIERERDSPRPTPSLPGSGGVHEPRLRRAVLIVS